MLSKLFFRIFIAPVINYRYNCFRKGLRHPELEQEKLLKSILVKLSSTQFGSKHQIKGNETYQDFCSKIALNSYSELASFLLADQQNKNLSLVNPSAIIWEKTSGSSEKKKMIPYNRYALRDFRDMIVYWVGDLVQSNLQLNVKKIFFSLSMHLENESGIESDTDYLPWYFRIFFKKYLLLPPSLKEIKDTYYFNLWLCIHLLVDKKINILFFWSPTYFLSLLDFIQENQTKIISCIEQQELNYQDQVYSIQIKDQRTLAEVKEIMRTQKWNDIDIISCWVDGSSRFFIKELKEHFPHAHIQGKGLLATEAPLTFPSELSKGYLPLLNNIFYEFLDSNNNLKLLHELEINNTYELIISNRSGLIRYEMNDLVQVTSIEENTPCFKFISRTGLGSDMTGEKIDLNTIEKIFTDLNINDDSFLLPILDNPSYYLLITNKFEDQTNQIEKSLCEYYHYQQSRNLNQLNALQVIQHSNPKGVFNQLYQNKGLKLGDIKFNRLFIKPYFREELDKIIG